MDPLTHAVVGLSLAVLAGEPISLSNPAMLGCIAGAVIPDIDIIMQIKGDYIYLKNHRGISHSIPMLAVFSALITGILYLAIGMIPIYKVLLLTFGGCLSHVLLDLTNSYGAQIFWPFYKKKVTFDLLLIYDPMLIILSLLIIFPVFQKLIPNYIILVIFAYYLAMRYYMKKRVQGIVTKCLGQEYDIKFMRVLPSMIGLIKWHFIIITEDEKIIGEFNIYPRKLRIIRKLKNIDKELSEIVMHTPLAEFFAEFTPIYHIECKITDEGYNYNFIDLRYFIAKDFLHHATAVINKDMKVVTSLFHPYTKRRDVQI